MKAFLSKIFAKKVVSTLKKENEEAIELQNKILREIIQKAKSTAFGVDHDFENIESHEDFCQRVPIKDYEQLRNYFDRIKGGESDILWPGRPIYLSKTSGTTSGAKYIPITEDSISNHIDSARNALLCYIDETGNSDFVKGKMIFLQGSPELTEENGIKIGRLSGIVAHHVPAYLLKNRMPSFEVNCIEEWEEKVEAIADETLDKDMRLISGIPPWVQMYFDVLMKKTGKSNIKDIFPNFSLLVYGGVNYKPYEKSIEKTIGKKVDAIEVYPASEGFIAYQDTQSEEGMRLNINSGIFYEFVKATEIFEDNPKRYTLENIELDENYAVILSNNAGLWAYNIGDTVKFVSKDPYRIIVSGRIKHFTSAFGEHVIAEEVEAAAKHVSDSLKIEIHEFHVAPVVNPDNGSLPHHEWLIDLEEKDADLKSMAKVIDDFMIGKNPYYKDLREGNILEQLRITRLEKNAFNNYMKSIGRLGGQNKLPRLSNDRKIADAMKEFILT